MKSELFSKKLLIGIAAAVVYFVLLKILGFVLTKNPVFVMISLLLNDLFKRRAADAGRVDPGACGAVCHLRYVPELVPLPNGILFRPVGLI